MRFKIDENLSASAKQALIDGGHYCHSVHDEEIGGGPDHELIEICREERRHLVTLDLDFADIITYPPGEYYGIIVLRLSSQDARYVSERPITILPAIEELELPGHLVVADDSRIRYR